MKWLLLSFLILTSTAHAAKFVCTDGTGEKPLLAEYYPDFDCLAIQSHLTYLLWFNEESGSSGVFKSVTLEYEKDLSSNIVRYRQDQRALSNRDYDQFVTVDAKRRDMEGKTGSKFNLKLHNKTWRYDLNFSFICEIIK